MKQTDGFYTLKGYALHADSELTSSMEDYLEMIARLTRQKESVRASTLSKMLHVKASSVTKMVQHLGSGGFIQAEKYGDIRLTVKGEGVGNYLLYRHKVLHRFLCVLNHSDNELEQVEKIEHFVNHETIKNLELLTTHLTDEKFDPDKFTAIP